MFDIEGKVALVTGGASGIGFEAVKQLLKNGAKGVMIADVDVNACRDAIGELEEQFEKKRMGFVETDVTNKQSFEDAFKQTINTFKNIDILVNNAGICNEKNYEKEIAVNLTGTIHGILLAIENYILNNKSGVEGVIMNTSSIAGCYGFPTAPIYAATKSGVVSLTSALGNRLNYERTKIKVLSIAPGSTATKLLDNLVHRSEHYDAMMKSVMNNVIVQPAEFVAKEMIEIIKEKPSGTIWICEEYRKSYEFIPAAHQKKSQ
ncbi:hypothetical protein WA026_010097 [Henosepilachna vigintioctopunctata]|uniref:Uncharacterized protein n=1 Tax=Henosepilachna vigintioctopunctata TaxID=420089 RepID=A0AAW1UC45_9CUCU